MTELPPAYRALLDRRLSEALDVLLEKAADRDGVDIIEANVDLMNELLAALEPQELAASAAALALRLHRSGARPVTVDHRVIMAFIQAPDEPEGDIGGPLRAAFRAAGVVVAE